MHINNATLKSVFFTFLFFLHNQFISPHIFDLEFDPMHQQFYQATRGMDLSDLLPEFFVIYRRAEFGYALCAYIPSNMDFSYSLFMNIWSTVIVFLIFNLTSTHKSNPVIMLLFICTSPQLSAVFHYAAAAKTFVFLYLSSFYVTKSCLMSTTIGLLGHLQSVGMLTFLEVIKGLKHRVIYISLFVFTSIYLIFGFEFEDMHIIISRADSFTSHIDLRYQYALYFTLLVGVLWILKTNGFLNLCFNMMAKLPIALWLELVLRTHRFTVNLALWLCITEMQYKNFLLILGLVYNIHAIGFLSL